MSTFNSQSVWMALSDLLMLHGVASEDISPEKSLFAYCEEGLGLDEFDPIEILMKIERAFSVEIADGAKNWTAMPTGDLAYFIAEKIR